LQGIAKFAQIGIFGMKIDHLATLIRGREILPERFRLKQNSLRGKKFLGSSSRISAVSRVTR
jgi:hypothetical protein